MFFLVILTDVFGAVRLATHWPSNVFHLLVAVVVDIEANISTRLYLMAGICHTMQREFLPSYLSTSLPLLLARQAS